jgi:hypothetical protein
VKLLLDQNLPHRMRHELPGHDVYTAAYMGWDAIEKRGTAAPRCAFDAVITNDRGLEYEQNLGTLPVAVVVVLATSNTIEAIPLLYPELLVALEGLRPREFAKVVAP